MPERIERDPLKRFRSVFTDVPTPGGGLPTMPRVISKQSSDQLGDMIANYSSWREFTEDRHMEACAVYSQVRSKYDFEADKIMLSSDDATVTEKKARAKTSNQLVPLAKEVLEAEIYRDLLASKLESFTNVLTMLSRELTRRGVFNNS